jgi:hypothetical protein
MKNNSLIPIIFISGTGGHFLMSLLITAYYNKHDPLKLGIHGDAHKTGYGQVHGNLKNVNNLKIFLEIAKEDPNRKFIGFHSIHVNKVKEYFNKVIVITYDIENIDELAKIFAIKWGLDQVVPPRDPLLIVKQHKIELRHALNHLKVPEDNHTCVVHWDELFRLDPNLLVSKLSSFTDIPIENFTIDNIINWREITNTCLDMFP